MHTGKLAPPTRSPMSLNLEASTPQRNYRGNQATPSRQIKLERAQRPRNPRPGTHNIAWSKINEA